MRAQTSVLQTDIIVVELVMKDDFYLLNQKFSTPSLYQGRQTSGGNLRRRSRQPRAIELLHFGS